MKTRRIAALFILTLFAAASAMAKPIPDSFADLAAKLNPSVVNISSTKVIHRGGGRGLEPPRGPNSDRFRDFFGDEFWKRFFGGDGGPGMKSSSLGSGFIWDADGTIVTNNHVVDGADEIEVRLSDGKKFTAVVVGTDAKTDLAVLKVDAGDHPMPAVMRGDSDALRVGDWVVAIGNPFGYGHTVTAGIVSAKERVIGSGPYDSFLQTDAAINPGNSGGPLFDIEGRVVGINSAIVSGSTGIGFAIPIKMADHIVSQLRKDGKVTRGWLGVQIQTVTEELAMALGLEEPRGALVADVMKESPAEKAGIERGDVIVGFDGVTIRDKDHLPFLVASHAPESRVPVEVIRKGEAKSIQVTLGKLPSGADEDEIGMESGSGDEKLGMTVQGITPDLRKSLGLDDIEGLVVSDVEPGSAAGDAGLRRGDVIVEVNQEAVTSVEELRAALAAAKKKSSALLLVHRGKGTIYLALKFPTK